MKEEFEKWLCELVGVELKYINNNNSESILHRRVGLSDCYTTDLITLEILIKAMWAINRDINTIYSIKQNVDNSYSVFPGGITHRKDFLPSDHNSSEQEALTAALIYVLDNEK